MISSIPSMVRSSSDRLSTRNSPSTVQSELMADLMAMLVLGNIIATSPIASSSLDSINVWAAWAPAGSGGIGFLGRLLLRFLAGFAGLAGFLGTFLACLFEIFFAGFFEIFFAGFFEILFAGFFEIFFAGLFEIFLVGFFEILPDGFLFETRPAFPGLLTGDGFLAADVPARPAFRLLNRPRESRAGSLPAALPRPPAGRTAR